jgi:TPP-dependent indolepyruvate ferredoxin oxidoreductase alpha subunit
MECVLEKCQKIAARHSDTEPPGICPGCRRRPDTGFLSLNVSAHLKAFQTFHLFMDPEYGCRTRAVFPILYMPGRRAGKKIKPFVSV